MSTFYHSSRGCLFSLLHSYLTFFKLLLVLSIATYSHLHFSHYALFPTFFVASPALAMLFIPLLHVLSYKIRIAS